MLPAGMLENVIVCTELEYDWLDAVVESVRSIRISGGASPRALNCVPQLTLFSALLVQYGLS